VSIQIERRLEDVDDLFRGEEATNIYRIIQEALNNMVKHAHATRAAVVVERDLHRVRIRVEDDGCGFDPSMSGDFDGHYGLISMKERAEQVKGRVVIESAPGHGTRVEAIVPMA